MYAYTNIYLMNNLRQRFEQYSNIELLKIVHRPDDYQPEAVETARQILTSRVISANEKEEVELFYEERALEQELRKEKIVSYNRKVSEFLEPILKPGDHVSPKKWLPIFLVLVVIQFVYMFVRTIIVIMKYIDRGIPMDGQLLISLMGLVYIPILFMLLYRRKRWGWILLLGDNLFSVVMLLSQSYFIFKYQEYDPDGPVLFLWQMSMRSVFIWFLWRTEIADYFNIEDESKIRIAAIIAVIAGLITLVLCGLNLY